MGEEDEEGALSVETEERVAKPRGKWRKFWIFLAGLITGGFVMFATCVGYGIHATFSMSKNEDFFSATVAKLPEMQRQRRLFLEHLVGVHLPETTVVRRMHETFGIDSMLWAKFETTEQDASLMRARLDEIRQVISDQELNKLRSVFDDARIEKPVRAWMLPRNDEAWILVLRLVGIHDGKAVWIIEDCL